MLDKWSKELAPNDLMCTLEPELHLEDDTVLVPRLYPYVSGNARYNTARRVVSEQVDPQETSIMFTGDEDS